MSIWTYTEIMLVMIASLLGGMTSILWGIENLLRQIRDKK